MSGLTGEIIATPYARRPYRAVVRRDGRIVAFRDASTEAAARRLLDGALRAADMAVLRVPVN